MNEQSYEAIRNARSILTVIMNSLPSTEQYVHLPADDLIDVLQQVIDKLNYAIDVSEQDVLNEQHNLLEDDF